MERHVGGAEQLKHNYCILLLLFKLQHGFFHPKAQRLTVIRGQHLLSGPLSATNSEHTRHEMYWA